jgi:hypothetical protein
MDLVDLLNHLSIDEKMALITNRVEQYFYSLFVAQIPLEYSNETLKRTRSNPHLVSGFKFLVETNETIVADFFLDEIDYVVINPNGVAAKADHVLHASCVIDVMKLSLGVEVGKDVGRKEMFDRVSPAAAVL